MFLEKDTSIMNKVLTLRLTELEYKIMISKACNFDGLLSLKSRASQVKKALSDITTDKKSFNRDSLNFIREVIKELYMSSCSQISTNALMGNEDIQKYLEERQIPLRSTLEKIGPYIN